MHRLIRSTLLAATLAALGPAQALAADTDGYPQGRSATSCRLRPAA